MNSEYNHFETPFADQLMTKEVPFPDKPVSYRMPGEMENPFNKTFELADENKKSSPFAGEVAHLLGELHDEEFSRSFYELASELEDTWLPKISNEAALGEDFLPFARRQASGYLSPLIKATEGMIDRISKHVSGNFLGDKSATEIDTYLSEFQPDATGLTPVQEQFLGSVFNKVKNAVKAGINAVGKILPVNIILDKIKGLVNPLFERVIRFAIGKLPATLQPYAKDLAKKLFNLETSVDGGVDASGEINTLQHELDLEIAQLLYAPGETEAGQVAMEYENSVNDSISNAYSASVGLSIPAVGQAREQLINELRQLQPGDNPAPAIERFLPAVLALKPLIKMGISVIGRPKVIHFLAGLLSKLIARYVPQNVVQPLASSIIDAGMTTIGFETYEMTKPDVGYEALVNTIEDTIQRMQPGENEADEEAMAAQLYEAFETAAVNHFPPQYIKEELRNANKPGIWVLKPRNGIRPLYKKYTTVFTVNLDQGKTKGILTFRDLPLSAFLQDKLGLDPAKQVTAKVHLYEVLRGTRLSQVSKHENLPGFGPANPYSWVQLHPLSKNAAAVLLNDPALGKDFPKNYTTRRYHITGGQRFYFLEIEGARLRMQSSSGKNRPAQSNDVHCTVNFIKSSLTLSYYFSEENALAVVSKLNQNDFTSIAATIRHSIQGVLQKMLTGNVSGKVKIIHEAFPEMFVENFTDEQEQFIAVGKNILSGFMESFTEKLAGKAYEEIRDYFKSRAAEFKQAQAQPEDGVTIQVAWSGVAGLAAIRTFITAIRERKFINPGSIAFPSLGKPEISFKPGKHFT